MVVHGRLTRGGTDETYLWRYMGDLPMVVLMRLIYGGTDETYPGWY